MSDIALILNINDKCVATSLQEAVESIHRAQGEAVLDFSCVQRIDSCALWALEDFARVADEKKVKVVLRGVSVDVYRVLNLVKVTQRFSFVN